MKKGTFSERLLAVLLCLCLSVSLFGGVTLAAPDEGLPDDAGFGGETGDTLDGQDPGDGDKTPGEDGETPELPDGQTPGENGDTLDGQTPGENGDSAVIVSEEDDSDTNNPGAKDIFGEKGGYTMTAPPEAMLTGDSASIQISFSDTESTELLRVYIHYDDTENGEFQCLTTNFNGQRLTLHPVDGYPGYYYYEITPPSQGATGTLSLDFTYPNGSKGGTLEYWFAAIPASSASDLEGAMIEAGKPFAGVDKISDTTYSTTWGTETAKYDVTKSLSTKGTLSLTHDEKTSIKNLSYTVSLKGDAATTNSGQALTPGGYVNRGADYVEHIQFTDVLTLPEKLEWRSGMEDATYATSLSADGKTATVTATIDGYTYTVATLTLGGTVANTTLSAITAKWNGEGVEIGWDAVNTKLSNDGNEYVNVGEIENPSVRIAYGDEVIMLSDELYNYLAEEDEGETDPAEPETPEEGGDEGSTARSWTSEPFPNDVHAVLNYYYSGDKPSSDYSDEETVTLTADGNLSLTKTKTTTKTYYFGDDVEYKITAKNSSPFDYKKFEQVEDTLDVNHYIKPADMVRIFEAAGTWETDEESGSQTLVSDCDSVVITVNSARMSSDGGIRNIIITYNYSNNTMTVLVSDPDQVGDPEPTSVPGEKAAAYLEGLFAQYDITSSTAYGVTWNIREGDRDMGEEIGDVPYQTLRRGEERTYAVYATFKDTFMLMDGKQYEDPDQTGFEEYYKDGVTAKNSVRVGNDAEAETTTPLTEELKVKKERTADQNFMNATVLDYTITITHKGGGAYKELPLQDKSQGAQAMMVKIADNEALADDPNVAGFPKDNPEYFVLLPGFSGTVTVTETKEGVTYTGPYTAKVNVSWAKDDHDNVLPAHESIVTEIEWIIPPSDPDVTNDKAFDTGGTWTETIVYKMLANHDFLGLEYPGEGSDYDAALPVENIATIRDLYYDTDGDVFLVEFDKNIVNPNDIKGIEDLTRSKFSRISPDDESYIVTYRLDFYYPDTATGNAIFTGANFFDVLPDTASVFAWSSNTNVEVSYKYDNGVTVTHNGAAVSSGAPADDEINVFKATEDMEHYKAYKDLYLITWDPSFRVSLKPGTGFYVYVTLTFPADEENNADTWNDYLKKLSLDRGTQVNRNLYVENTLFFYGYPKNVNHQLAGNTLAGSIQKGVYETGFFTQDPDSETLKTYYRRADRTTYLNNEDNGGGQDLTAGVVTYYMVLYNDGSTNLYLDTIYDVLPEGFSYRSLRTYPSNVGSTSATAVGQSLSLPTSSSSTYSFINSSWSSWANASRVRSASGNYVYVVCDSETLIDGHQVLQFSVTTSGKDNLNATGYGIGYDAGAERYYLAPGYYLAFAYECYTGDEDASNVEAVNTVAMPLTGNENKHVTLDTMPNARVNTTRSTNPSTIRNDGDRGFWDSDTALSKGFTHVFEGGSFAGNWLGSSVTVRRGSDILPGIRKSVLFSDDTSAEWSVMAYNEGTTTMKNYQIVDRMQLPYQFNGKVYYENYASNAASGANTRLSYGAGSNNELMTIETDGFSNVVSITSNVSGAEPVYLYLDPLSPEYGKTAELTFDIRYTSGHVEYGVPATVSITQDDTWQILTLTFEDVRWGITSTGYVELHFETENFETPIIARDQVPNEATLFPAAAFNKDLVTKGAYVEDTVAGTVKPGVRDQATISVMIDSPTASYKEVRELEPGTADVTVSGQYAHSDSATVGNKFVLTDKVREIRYTLTVHASTDYDMDQLILIDNLPEEEDSGTLFDQPRGSAFTIALLEDPNFEVTVNGQVLDKSRYDVQYKISESSGDFDHGDWSGGYRDDGDDPLYDQWLTYDPDTTPEGDLSAARDLRVIVYGLKSDGSRWEPNASEYVPAATFALTRNSTITFSFNAKIEDPNNEASYGDIGWNSFGYEYFTGLRNNAGQLEEHYLYAAPRKVGISIAGVPELTKVLTKSNGTPATAEQDLTFKYVVYEGDAIDFSIGADGEPVENPYAADVVGNALNDLIGTDNERKFTYFELTVPYGASSSAPLLLGDMAAYAYDGESFDPITLDEESGLVAPFEWTQNGKYTIVELTTDNSDSGYVFKSVKEGTANSTQRNYTFTYTSGTNMALEYNNGIPTWGFDLDKHDQADADTKLAGAIFGLYSPDKNDRISDAELARWTTGESALDPKTVPLTFVHTETRTDPDGNTFEETKTYYLYKIAETNEDGNVLTWRDNLEETSYIVYELKAPDGYARETQRIVVTKDEYIEKTQDTDESYLTVDVAEVFGPDTVPAVVSLDLTKSVLLPNNGRFDGGTFAFDIVPGDNPASDPLEGKPYSVEIEIAGRDDLQNVTRLFEALAFTQTGEYTYTVTEAVPEDADADMEYNTTAFEVTVTVTEDKDASDATKTVLKAEISVKGADVEDSELGNPGFTVENNYTAPCAYQIVATKVYVEGILFGDDFEFVLEGGEYTAPEGSELDEIAVPMPGGETSPALAYNDADGVVNFGEIAFTQAGTYTYTMYETIGSDEDTIYDETVYTITVTVTEHTADNGSIWLEATATFAYPYQDEEGNDQSQLVAVPSFTNENTNPNKFDDPDDPDGPDGPGGPGGPGGGPDGPGGPGGKPQTGDNSKLGLWISIMMLSLVGVLFAAKRKVR